MNYRFDIFLTLRNFLNNIIYIALSFLIIGLMAYFYTKNMKDSYVFDVEVHQLSETESHIYKELDVYGIYSLDSKLLLSYFIEKIKYDNIFFEAFKKNNFISKNLSSDVIDTMIKKEIAKVKVIDPTDTEIRQMARRIQDIDLNYRISYTTTEKEKFIKILEDSIILANNKVYDKIIEDFNNSIYVYEQRRKFEIDNLVSSLDFYINDNQFRNEKYIKFLEEQSILARSLGYDTLQLDHVLNTKNPGFQNVLRQDDTYYLRGYKAIEKEIEIILNRPKDEINFGSAEFSNYSADREKLNKLLTDKSVTKTQKAFDKIFINRDFKEKFKTAIINTSTINYKTISSKRITFLIILISGMSLVIVFFMIMDVYRQTNTKKSKKN